MIETEDDLGSMLGAYGEGKTFQYIRQIPKRLITDDITCFLNKGIDSRYDKWFKTESTGSVASYLCGVCCSTLIEIYPPEKNNKATLFVKLYLTKYSLHLFPYLESFGVKFGGTEKKKQKRIFCSIDRWEKVFNIAELIYSSGYSEKIQYTGILGLDTQITNSVNLLEYFEKRFASNGLIFDRDVFDNGFKLLPPIFSTIEIKEQDLTYKLLMVEFEDLQIDFNIRWFKILINELKNQMEDTLHVNRDDMRFVPPTIHKNSFDGQWPPCNLVFNITEIGDKTDEGNKDRKSIPNSIMYKVFAAQDFTPGYSIQDVNLIRISPLLSYRMICQDNSLQKYIMGKNPQIIEERSGLATMLSKSTVTIESQEPYMGYDCYTEHLIPFERLQRVGFNPDIVENLYEMLRCNRVLINSYDDDLSLKFQHLIDERYIIKTILKRRLKNILENLKSQIASPSMKDCVDRIEIEVHPFL